MKKFFIFFLVAMALFSLAQKAAADQVTFLGGPYQSPAGGEFTILPLPVGGTLFGYLDNYVMGVTRDVSTFADTFQTFCIERNEYIGPGTYEAVLNTNAVNGGVGPAGDPISIGTAYLYSQFAAGILSDYDYTNPGRSGEVGTAYWLQQTIWYLEGEIGSISTNAFLTMVNNLFTDPKADNNGEYPVMALNLYKPDGSPAQDVLIRTPEPFTLLLLGLGLLGIAGIRRKL